MNAFFPALFILFIAIGAIKRNDLQLQIKKIRKRRKEQKTVDNSLLMRYIGKECIVQANGYIAGLVGKIIEVSGNWITIEDKKGKLTTFNCDYISSIKEK